MDGVPDVSQPEVKRGETFTYDFVVRDAGLYWYHPHVMSAAQVGFGLYGALLVDDPADGVGVADQLTLVLSDIGFDRHGVLDSPDTGGPAGMVFGREGAYVLANGKILPTLRARSGAPQRWRIVNAAKSRFFLLDLEGQDFYVIGSDGGLQERPETTDLLLVTPGERVDVIVTPTGPSRRDAHVARGLVQPRLRQRRISHSRRRADDCVQRRAAAAETGSMPALHRDIAAPSLAGATHVDVVLTLPPAGPDGKSEFHVNGVPFWKAKPFLAKVGETQIWTVKNETKWAHPMHLHGFFFLPLDEQLQPIRPMAWKDTLDVPIDGHDPLCGGLRRAARHVDVPLPYPRPRGRRPDGPRASPPRLV